MARLIKEEILRDLGRLWGIAQIRPDRLVAVTQAERKIVENRARYVPVAEAVGCPWWLVGLPHGLERGYSFRHHLHNGDPLARQTTRVPANRPVGWMDLTPDERTWERSAIDALKRMGWDSVKNWTIPEALYRLEAFNGWGYRMYHPEVPSPYLWSFLTVYTRGKYSSDGKFDPRLVSQQVGAAAILKRLVALGIAFPEIEQAKAPPDPVSDPRDISAIRSYPRGGNVQLLPHFHLREFACHCGRCPVVLISPTHLALLQQLRNALKRPITVTSGHRCAKHNAAVGGVADSQHPRGTATDIKVAGLTPAQVAEEAERIGFDGIGRYRTFTHLDSRGSRARWNG